MTGERKRGDESSVEAWDDEGGAAEREEAAAGEAADRAKRWADEHTEHWHGATSSDSSRGRADEGRAPE